MNIRVKLLVAIILYQFFLFVHAQGLIDVRHYSIEDGLSQNIVQDMLQDDDGYKYKTNLNNIKMGATPIKFHKRNPFTVENMCLYIKENNIPVELVDKSSRTVDVKNYYLDF